MENYIKELADICGLPFGEVTKDTKVIMLGTKMVYVGNYRKLLTYGEEKIDLRIKKDILHISGENMKIAQMDKGEIVVVGKIYGVMVDSYDKNATI